MFSGMSLFGGSSTPAAGTFGTPLKRSQTLPLSSEPAPQRPQLTLTGLAPTSASPSTAQRPSLFPPATSSAPTQSFGSSLLAGSAPAQSSSLFSGTSLGGSLFDRRQQQGSGLGSSLFGAQNTSSQPPAAGPLFAGLTQSTAADPRTVQPAPTKSAYFDQMLERGKRRNAAEDGNLGDLPSLQLGLGDIARKARNLGTGGPSATEAKLGDPRAHYLLAASGVSTASALRDLNNFSAQVGPSASQNQDTDLDGFVSGLRTQSTMEMIQESLQQSKRDFDNFLEENVQMNWDAQRRKIYDHFGLGDAYENAPQNLGTSRNLRGAFAKSTGSRTLGSSKMQFGNAGLHKSVLGSSVNAALKASLSPDSQDKNQTANSHGALEELAFRDKQERYSAKVVELNEARNQNQCYPIFHQLASVEDEASDQSADFIVNSYRAVIQLVEEQSSTLRRNDPAVVSWERKFTQGYVNEAPNSAAAVTMRKRIINASRKCLERMFWSKIDGVISKDPKVANLGGIPQPINKVRAYIRVRAQRKELVTHASGQDEGVGTLQQILIGSDSDYCWVLIFYLLRCGLIKEAAQYVSDNQRAIRSLDRHFGKYIEAYAGDADHRLSAELRQEIQTNYYGRTRIAPENQVDPYRIACYKVIGRCELSRKTLDNIPVDEEDWMWLQFALAREVNRAEEAAGETFGLEELRHIVADIEKRHFNSTSDQAGNHGTLFFLQILSGMYEQAIASLYGHNHVAAVHFAIGLAYYGLLRVADLTTEEILSRNTRDEPILQFALLVGCFTASFRSAKPDVATDYLVLLALNADLPGEGGRRQGRLCLDSLRELVLETREFAQLLGDIRSDGQKIPGAIQMRAKLIQRSMSGERDTELAKFIKDLTVQAALAADEGGRTTDAVLLYHLAEEFDNVLTIVNRTLSEALTVELGRQAMRIEPLKPRENKGKEPLPSQSTLSLTAVDDPVVLAKNMYDLYSAASRQNVYQRIKPATREATHTLVAMAAAKQNLLAHNYLAALEAIGGLDVLPLNAAGDVAMIRQYAQNFALLPPVVGRCVGDVLIWAVLACNGERDRLVRDGWEVDGRRNMVLRLNGAVADLGIFAGLVRYKLRQEVFDTLARAGDGS